MNTKPTPSPELPDLETVIAFLLGEGPLLGQHFGDKHPDSTTYWWRFYLRSAARRAQPEGEAVPVPTSVDMARLMLGLSYRWLKDNAPEHVPAGQPEGEAPQAILQVMEGEFGEYWMDAEKATFDAANAEGITTRTVYTAPAAQHAESGAPAPDAERVDAIVTGLYRRFKDWSKRGFGADDVTWCEVKADVIALIAAGAAESGAPASSLTTVQCSCVAADRTPVCDDCGGQGRLIVGKHDLADHLAAQSQGAQAADAYLTCLSVACSFDHDSRERHAAMDCVRAVQAAQQAAAPGAEGKYAKALRNLLLDVECGILDGDARREARDLLDSEDDSAPGTPEAPKPPFPISDDEMAALRRFWECATDGEGYDVEKPMMQRLAEMGLVQRKSGAYYMATEFGLYVLGEYTMERAAQLDGGQEEGKAHA